ncbi:DUF1707 SHOCT-like domain-containing protein [Streptomyces abyssalis]|uniref:DUF1707 SHOCT-like domain-containing protein n=1 Tax=Streptomyces abyssalis TaxID=933944 RepID=UPI00085CD3DD|nr:DUF1707 domain-containing protein [Streptomyces abyssalis]
MSEQQPEPVSKRLAQRASDDDREQVVERLRDAASEGRIDLAEFEERMTLAYQARTYGELEPITADLPEIASPAPQQELVLRAHGSTVRREGRWPVPRRIDVEAKHGAVRLDMTEAVVLAGEVAVEVDLQHSSVRVLVPEGTEVVDDGLVLKWGSVKYGSDDREGAPQRARFRVRLSGEGSHSSVAVTTPNVFDALVRRLKLRWRRFARP